MSCGVGPRRGLDPTLLRLLFRLAATPLIGPLAWKPPYAAGVSLKKKNKKKTKKTLLSKKKNNFVRDLLHLAKGYLPNSYPL